MSGDEVVLRWAGAIDFSVTGQLEREVEEAIRTGPDELVIDLFDVTFTDSSGLGLLVHARNRCDENGVPLAVRGASSSLVSVLTITGLDKVLRLI